MADMNAWVKTIERRAAEAALLRLRYDASELPDNHNAVRLIDQHIEKYRAAVDKPAGAS